MNRVMSTIAAVVSMLAMTLGVPAWVAATLIVDQQNVIDTSGSNWTYSEPARMVQNVYNEFAQTFTVGVAGILFRVDVETYHSSATSGIGVFSLGGTTGAGVPDPSVGFSNWSVSDVNSSSTPGSFVSHDLGANAFAVLPGQVYAITFSIYNLGSGISTSGRRWVSGTSDTYAGGESFYQYVDGSGSGVPFNGVSGFQALSGDFGFRTWVDVSAAVPEPSTMILLGSGLVGLAGFARRKIKK